MKIYVEPLGKNIEVEEIVNGIVSKVPDDTSPEIKTIVKTLADLASNQYRISMELHQENAKLRCKWSLRHLENEINSEGGTLIITEKSDVKIKGFSPDLAQKISDVAKRGLDE
jgi:hypothetical protein